LSGQKYTKYNKINNKSETVRGGKIAAGGAFAPAPSLVTGLSISEWNKYLDTLHLLCKIRTSVISILLFLSYEKK